MGIDLLTIFKNAHLQELGKTTANIISLAYKPNMKTGNEWHELCWTMVALCFRLWQHRVLLLRQSTGFQKFFLSRKEMRSSKTLSNKSIRKKPLQPCWIFLNRQSRNFGEKTVINTYLHNTKVRHTVPKSFGRRTVCFSRFHYVSGNNLTNKEYLILPVRAKCRIDSRSAP